MGYASVFIEDKTNPDSPKIDIFTVDMRRIGFKASDPKAVSEGKEQYRSHIINLDKARKYIVAIDQSTSSSGISIVTENFDRVIILTVIASDKSEYTRSRFVDAFLELLCDALREIELIFVALERVPPKKGLGKGHREWEVLVNLKSRIETELSRLPSVACLPPPYRPSPLPNQWKSTIYNKKVGEKGGHFNNKLAIAQDICKLYPTLKEYLAELKLVDGHDYDGFDSFGILTHVRLKHFGKNWEPINQESRAQFGLFHALFYYCSSDGIEFMQEFIPWSSMKRPDGTVADKVDVIVWNDDVPIYGNLVMMANSNKIMLSLCTNTTMVLAHLIETGIPYDSEKRLWVAVFKESSELISNAYIKKFVSECGFVHHAFYKGVKKDGIT